MATRMHISRTTRVAAPVEWPGQAKAPRALGRVLILDGHCSAARAFVRSLGRAGHWVAVGATENLLAPASLSRYCRLRLEYPDPTRGAARFGEAVLRFVHQHGIQLVLPMTDATVEPLAQQRDAFRGKAKLVVASPAALGIVSDKYQTISLAQELGIPIPKTRLIRSLEDIPDPLCCDFPIVIKDRYSARWVGEQAVSGSVAYAYSKEGLQTKVAQRLRAAKDVLIQEFVPGRGIGFSCFVVDGEVYLPFQWERIREKDPRGSGSSARRSIPLDAQVLRMGRDLVTRAGFQGICMVEFKQDTRNGRLTLMEINGRPWGSIQLPIHSGVDYPRHLADWYLCGSLPPKWIDYKTGITCKWLTAELGHLENLWQGKPAGWPVPYPNFWTTLLKIAIPWYPGLRYDDLSWSDPKPGLTELVSWFRRHLGGNAVGRH